MTEHDEIMGTLQRIAGALERQVEQQDEAVARNLALRDENIRRNDAQREAELVEARAANAQLFAKLNETLAFNKQIADMWTKFSDAAADRT